MTEQLVYIDGELYHADDFTSEELAHYGVKGMKWGRRKLRQKNNQAFNRYAERSNKSAAVYDRQVRDLKAKRKAGQIDRATYKAGKNKAFDSFAGKEARYASQYRDTVKRNKAKRKEAIKKNRAKAAEEAFNYSNQSGKGYRQFLSSDINLARANGLSRGQALRNAYTGNYSRERIYNR